MIYLNIPLKMQQQKFNIFLNLQNILGPRFYVYYFGHKKSYQVSILYFLFRTLKIQVGRDKFSVMANKYIESNQTGLGPL